MKLPDLAVVDPRVTTGPLVVADACVECGSRGTVYEGGKYVHGDYVGGTERPCPSCAARTALAALLVRGDRLFEARWDQVVRDEYGDEVCDRLEALLASWRVPVAAYAESRVSERGVKRR